MGSGSQKRMGQGGLIMKRHPLSKTPENRSLLTFFVLVVIFSIPIWLTGAVAGRFLPEGLLGNLPISSLMAFCPILAAVFLVRRETGSGAVKRLLKRALDYKRIRRKVWYVPILFLMPAMMVIEYGVTNLLRGPLPEPQIPVLSVLASFVVFFIAAVGEEVGWQGYAIDPLQERWNALKASVILGTVWAAWHIVPFLQMNRTPAWIAGQCLMMVVARILYVWLYNNTARSVFAVIVFHAMHNVTTVLLTGYGWPYNPFLALIILAVAAAIVIFLWGPNTLARYRYARPGRHVPSKAARPPVS
jgi:membrane protease YdiL (CAAX protease family)